MRPEGCCSVREAIAEGKESTGKEEWVQKRNFPHVTPSIFGSHVNRMEDKQQTMRAVSYWVTFKLG